METIHFNGSTYLTKNLVCVYKIESPSGRIYIGQTRNLRRRLKEYRSKTCRGQQKIYASIAKYGYDKHEISVIEVYPSEISKVDLDSYEIGFIAEYRLTNKMLNLSYSDSNNRHCEETRAKMSVTYKGRVPWNKGLKQSEAHRAINSKSHMGVVSRKPGFSTTEETKAKIRAKLKGRKPSPETVEKIRLKSIGRKMPESAKKVLSEKLKGNKNGLGKICSPEKRAKISASQIGKKWDYNLGDNNVAKRPEVREKIRLSKLKYWENKRLENAIRNNQIQQ